jgi:hypothetical protein
LVCVQLCLRCGKPPLRWSGGGFGVSRLAAFTPGPPRAWACFPARPAGWWPALGGGVSAGCSTGALRFAGRGGRRLGNRNRPAGSGPWGGSGAVPCGCYTVACPVVLSIPDSHVGCPVRKAVQVFTRGPRLGCRLDLMVAGGSPAGQPVFVLYIHGTPATARVSSLLSVMSLLGLKA